MFSFLNSALKIKKQYNDSISEFIISYPRKNGNYISLGKDIITNVLKDNDIIVHINTSLCFSTMINITEVVKELKSALRYEDIIFHSRVIKGSGNSNSLGSLFQMSKKKSTYELVTFKLPRYFNNEKLLDTILKVGCEIYVPTIEQFDEGIILQVFNHNFDEDEVEDKFLLFKYILYINNFVEQAVIRTKVIDLSDVEKLTLIGKKV